MKGNSRLTILAVIVITALIVAPATVLASHRFTDVAQDNQFHEAISTIAQYGITKGCTEDQFCPDRNVTREQMAAFLARTVGRDGQEPVVNAALLNGAEVVGELVTVGIDNAENNDEECVPQTSSFGADLNFPDYAVNYQLFASPEDEGILPFHVNVALRYTDEVPESGRHLVCLATIDGSELPDGPYSLYRVEFYDRLAEPPDLVP